MSVAIWSSQAQDFRELGCGAPGEEKAIRFPQAACSPATGFELVVFGQP